MGKSRNTKKSIVSIITCISVAAPIVCFPVGTTDNSSAKLTVRRAYAATFPESQIADDIVYYDDFANYYEEMYGGEMIQVQENQGYESTYTEEYLESLTTKVNYNDIPAYTVIQDYDSSDLPKELLDPMYFAPDETTYYIKAGSSILKEKPDMDSMTVTTLDYGQEIVRIGIGDTWSKIRTEYGNEGYVLTNTLSIEMVWVDIDRIVWVDTGSLTLRAEPSTQSEVVATLPDETRLHCTKVADKWFFVTTPSGLQGYVYRSYTTETPPPTPTPTPTPKPPTTSSGGGGGGGGGGSSSSSSGGGSKSWTNYGNCGSTIVSICESMLGTPYVWAACSSTAVDCSGLVCYAYGLLGYSLPHYSVDLMSVGYGVSRDNIAPGDIVCWDTGGGYCGHVGIYVGGGQVIHAAGVRWGTIYGSVDMHPILTIRRIF